MRYPFFGGRLHTVAISFFRFILAMLFAMMEIEGEGKYGWAEKYPTWYRMSGGWIVKTYVALNRKPLTGYHAAFFPIPLMIFAYPMVAAGDVSWAGCISIIATCFAWFPLQDFAWFILNPHYGINEFRSQNVWWFGKETWLFGRIPISYISAWGAALVLSAISGGLAGGWLDGLLGQVAQLGIYLLLAAALAAFGAHRFHRYYARMRESDHRDQAGIYHN